jgi:hypothetical protein
VPARDVEGESRHSTWLRAEGTSGKELSSKRGEVEVFHR